LESGRLNIQISYKLGVPDYEKYFYHPAALYLCMCWTTSYLWYWLHQAKEI